MVARTRKRQTLIPTLVLCVAAGSATLSARAEAQQPPPASAAGAPPPPAVVFPPPPPWFMPPPPPPVWVAPPLPAPTRMEYDEDEPIPSGYRLKTSPRFPLIVAGASTTLGLWAISMMAGVSLEHDRRAT